MDSRTAGLAFLTILAGCSSTTVEGRIVDGMLGTPAGGFKLIASATAEDAGMSCQFMEAEVAEDGTFALEKLCLGSAYKLKADRDEVWLADVDEVPDGGFPAEVELKVWRAPSGSGLYVSSAAGLEPLKTVSDVARETIRGTDVQVRYPEIVPNKIRRIGPEEHLLIIGQGTIENTKILPLIPSGERVFGDDSVRVTMEPWPYVGVEFEDDTTYELRTTTFDAAKVLDKEKGDRVARWIAGDAVAAGRYAALKDDDRRMYIVEFGPGAAKAPDEASAAADAE